MCSEDVVSQQIVNKHHTSKEEWYCPYRNVDQRRHAQGKKAAS